MKPTRGNLLDEIRYDLNFVRSHTLQPKWFKFGKIVLLIGFIIGYAILFGFSKVVLFVGVFFVLGAVLHITYRVKTKKYTQSWLDFVIYEENGERKMKRIGKHYYPAVLLSAAIAVVVSQICG